MTEAQSPNPSLGVGQRATRGGPSATGGPMNTPSSTPSVARTMQ